jgi:hypothetical protein
MGKSINLLDAAMSAAKILRQGQNSSSEPQKGR